MYMLNDFKNFVKKYWYNALLTFVVLLGIFLRLKGLLANPSMWHDESALAWNILNKSYQHLFEPLRFLQMTPPLFLVFSKFLVGLFHASNKIGMCDLILRLIPFSCGVLSIGVFYLICRELFNTKKVVLIALILFCVNKILIDYSFEFKPYSVDVLVSLLLVLFFIKLNLSKINYKSLVTYAVGISLSIWFSFTSVFVLAAGLLNLLIRNFKKENIKKFLILILPLFVSLLLYFKFFVLNVQNNGHGLAGFWDNNFVAMNLSNLFSLFVQNLSYFFYPAKLLLFIVVLFVCGIILFYKEREKKQGINFVNIALLTFVFLVIASMLHIYPFSQRLIIFLIPFFIILMAKCADNKEIKFKSFIVAVMILMISFPQLNFALKTLKSEHLNKGDFSREMMQYLAKNIKPDDIIFVNNGSIADFSYYSGFYKIKNETVFKTNGENIDKNYFEFLKNLKKGSYWFYLPYDYSYGKDINFLKNWARENTEILEMSSATQSTLIHLKIK